MAELPPLNLPIPNQKQCSLALNTREKLAERAVCLRELWQLEKDASPLVWDPKRRKHVRRDPKWGFIRRTVDENFPEMEGVKRDVSFTDVHLTHVYGKPMGAC